MAIVLVWWSLDTPHRGRHWQCPKYTPLKICYQSSAYFNHTRRLSPLFQSSLRSRIVCSWRRSSGADGYHLIGAHRRGCGGDGADDGTWWLRLRRWSPSSPPAPPPPFSSHSRCVMTWGRRTYTHTYTHNINDSLLSFRVHYKKKKKKRRASADYYGVGHCSKFKVICTVAHYINRRGRCLLYGVVLPLINHTFEPGRGEGVEVDEENRMGS